MVDAARPILLALDFESVLVPEIWPAIADAAGISALRRTTRDTGNYRELMQERLELCRARGITFATIRSIVDGLEPLEGAGEFLRWARARSPVVLLSDTFHELAAPLLAKLDHPLLLGHSLRIGADGFIADYHLRQADAKREAVAALQQLAFCVHAVGDSHNDLTMLARADRGFLFRPPAALRAEQQYVVVDTYRALRDALVDAGGE